MSKADIIYAEAIKDVVANGYWDRDQKVRTRWADDTPAYTKSLINKQLQYDNTEVPILTTKKVAWKTAIKEMLWIWQQKDNNVDNLNKQGVRIWNDWKQNDGTIGKSYGYQMGKKCRVHPETNVYIDQVDYLLYELSHNPASRRHVTSLWNIDDLDEMSLNPCVWATQWLIKQGRLHLIVGVRSNDSALGNPFNVFQYYVLQRMIAQITEYELGTLTFNVNDFHIYERHISPVMKLIQREAYPAPKLWINPEVKNFYDFTISDFKLIDYKHGDKVEMEIAI